MKKVSVFAWAGLMLAAAAMALASVHSKAATAGPITGTWECVSGAGTEETKFTLNLQEDGEKVTGSVDSDQGGMDITSGTFKEDTLEIRLETPQGDYVIKGKLKDGQLAGEITLDGKPHANWEGKKSPSASSK